MDTLNGLDSASTNSTQAPLSHVTHWLALSLQRHVAKRKQALAVSTSGGTSIFCSETYIPDCSPWRSTRSNCGSCTAWDPGFLPKDSVVLGWGGHQAGSGCGFRRWLGSTLKIRLTESTAEPQRLEWMWDRGRKPVQWCNQFVRGEAIP